MFNKIETAISLYLKKEWKTINLLTKNVIAISIWFFEGNEKEVLENYLKELDIEYVGYSSGYNYFIDIFIEN